MEKAIFQFNGQRNDVGAKFVPEEYFFETYNINQDDIVGFNKTLCPSIEKTIDVNNAIDGFVKFRYLDSNNVLQESDITICGGKVYNGSTVVYSGLSIGKCQTAILNDKLFIVNGVDYPLIYDGTRIAQMGAPLPLVSSISGILNGSYKYAMTYVTSGGEEILGTVSSTVTPSNRQVNLKLPIGYAGTLSRKIYRTKNGGNILYLIATIADNTTLTYTDNATDATLLIQIPSINNECPKPKYIISSNNFRLIASGDTNFPTQAWVSDTNIEVLDKANFTDISNRCNDNSPIMGMSEDYGRVIIGSKKQIYIMDVTSTPSVDISRCNVGVADGYSMVKMPTDTGFSGGVMFAASDFTIRLFNGNFSDPVPSSLDNIKTENWAQQIRGTLKYALQGYTNICSAYFEYKYHLVIDDKFFIFDTRTLAWQILSFRTTNNLCLPNILANFDNKSLYIGRRNGGYIEKMYVDTQYIGEDLPAKVTFPYWAVSETLKYFRELHIYYKQNCELNLNIDININDNPILTTNINTTNELVFDSAFFNSNYYAAGSSKEDYKVLYLNQYGNWIQFAIEIPAIDKPITVYNSNFFDPNYYLTPDSVEPTQNPFGNMSLIRGIRLVYDEVSNKEAA